MPEGIQNRGVQGRRGTKETQIDSNVTVTCRACVDGVLKAAIGTDRGSNRNMEKTFWWFVSSRFCGFRLVCILDRVACWVFSNRKTSIVPSIGRGEGKSGSGPVCRMFGWSNVVLPGFILHLLHIFMLDGTRFHTPNIIPTATPIRYVGLLLSWASHTPWR
jgi:hypothetical protein